MKQNTNTILIALLGVVLGVLVTMVAQKVLDKDTNVPIHPNIYFDNWLFYAFPNYLSSVNWKSIFSKI